MYRLGITLPPYEIHQKEEINTEFWLHFKNEADNNNL